MHACKLRRRKKLLFASLSLFSNSVYLVIQLSDSNVATTTTVLQTVVDAFIILPLASRTRILTLTCLGNLHEQPTGDSIVTRCGRALRIAPERATGSFSQAACGLGRCTKLTTQCFRLAWKFSSFSIFRNPSISGDNCRIPMDPHEKFLTSFESAYCVMSVSDSRDQKRTIVLQTVFVMIMCLSLALG